MTDPALESLAVYRALPNGNTLRRTAGAPWRLFIFSAAGAALGEVTPGSTAAQVLALTPADWGEASAESSPEIVAGPQPVPPHAPSRRMSFAERMAAIRERWSALFRR